MSRVSEAAFRARLRETPNTRAVCVESSSLAAELGFERSIILLDERDRGIFRVDTPSGYPETERFENVRLRRSDESVAQLEEGTLASPMVLCDLATTPMLATLGLTRAVAFGLRDSAGIFGFLVAGHEEGGAAWPDTAPQELNQLLPDIIATLRHRILAQVVVEDRATLLAQKAEIEMLALELRRRNDEMLDDLEQAREFQAQMMGRPPKVNGLSVQLAFRPLDAVSGDLVDVFYEGTRLRVFVSDTTGHGLRAGLATMLLKAEWEAVKRLENPGTVLRELNSRIVGTYRSSALTMTALCFDLDLATGEVVYASAAHPCAVVVRDGSTEELPTGGTLLGLVPELDLKEGRSRVDAGEGIYAYTDGISEATSPTNELFGEERVIAALASGHRSGTSVRLLEKAAVTFTQAGGFSDDATIIGIAREPRA